MSTKYPKKMKHSFCNTFKKSKNKFKNWNELNNKLPKKFQLQLARKIHIEAKIKIVTIVKACIHLQTGQ